jgi:hypothetical protein
MHPSDLNAGQPAEVRLLVGGSTSRLALHGVKPIPESNPSKEKRWGRRKLKRDE